MQLFPNDDPLAEAQRDAVRAHLQGQQRLLAQTPPWRQAAQSGTRSPLRGENISFYNIPWELGAPQWAEPLFVLQDVGQTVPVRSNSVYGTRAPIDTMGIATVYAKQQIVEKEFYDHGPDVRQR